MLKLRVLTTVSAVALATAAGMSGAKANNLVIDLTNPSLTITAGSSALPTEVGQINSAGEFTGDVSDIVIGLPTDRGQSHNLGGGTNNLIDSENEIFAIATGNTKLSVVDFYAATNGGIPGDNGAATLGVLQLNSDSSDIVASVELGDIQIDVIDLGAGSSVEVDGNAITADGKGNNANSSIAGDVNFLQNSTEVGQATISTAVPLLTAGATALVGSAQFNTGAPAMDATITDSRIGLLARVDAEAAIVNVPLVVTDNTIAATFTGNDAVSGVALTAGGAITLVGTAGAINIQGNDGDFSIDALVQDVVIEAGDTQNYLADEYIATLTGSSLTFEGNEITAAATSNQATNSVNLAAGLSQDGVASSRLNNVDFSGVDESNVNGDLFIANAQFSAVGVTADIDQGDFNVLVRDSYNSSVSASDNIASASATGSGVSNEILVANTTDFDSLVAINSLQYTEGTQSASNDTLFTVTVAEFGGIGQVINSDVTVDGNEASALATGNSHSSKIDITGTSVDGAGALILNPILVNRVAQTGSVSADISILNAQVLDGGSAVADVLASIDVNLADDSFITSNLSVSDNEFTARAIGNLSTEASIAIEATTIAASVAILSSQTVEDGTQLTASIAPQTGLPAFIDVDVGENGPANVDEAAVAVDNNTFDARVWGNLADATTNSILVDGVDVSDGQLFQSAASVQRGAGVPFTALDSGFALVNDQSVEDLEGAIVTASATGDLINLTVGSVVGSIVNSDFSASDNSATTSATLNQATNKITVNATTLEASSGLVNVQTLADEDNNGSSAQMAVSQNGLAITIDLISGDDAISDVSATASDNSMLASARINQATNTVAVTAQTQNIVGVIDSATVNGTDSATLSTTGTHAQGESLLVNEQAFESLGTGGVAVSIFDADITINVAIDDDDLERSDIDADNNSITALAAGNDATNTLTLNVGSFDLSDADITGAAATNGPIATIASNQYGLSNQTSGGFSTIIDDATIAVDVNRNDTTDLVASNLSVDGNAVRAISRANNVSNTLTSSGTTVANSAPQDQLTTVDGDEIIVDQTAFTVASRQVNSVDVSSTIIGTAISVEAGSVFGGALDDEIIGSSLTANSNVVVAEARGNDAVNSMALNYTQNEASAVVANLQLADAPVTYSASNNGTFITVLTDSENVENGSFTASGNAVASLASANRATNVLNSGGTNVEFRNGDNLTVYDPAGGPDVGTDASLSVVNVQGNLDTPVAVNAEVNGTLIGAIVAGDVTSGSVSADNNLILAQAAQHNATNTLNITASANINSNPVDDRTPGASVVSLQSIGDGSVTDASVFLAGITAIADDTRSDGSVALSAVGNDIMATAIGATANNMLRATAEASISANAPYSQALGGTDPTEIQAGFSVLNAQLADNASFTASIAGAAIVAGGLEDYSFDAVTVSDNVVQAEARGLLATNALVLTAGSSSDATGVVANLQVQTSSEILADVTGVAILTGNIDEGAENSALIVGGNAVNAIATANRATNVLLSSAGATLQESSGAGSVIDPTASSPVTVTGTDYAVLNVQSTDGNTVSADISLVGIGIDGLQDTTGVNNSALSVEGNQVQATAIGNEAINNLVLNTGTFQHPSAGISNLQTNNGTTVSASVDGVAIGIGGVATINAASNNSSLTVRGNSVGATAIGNSATNVLRSGTD
ncbi:hypothetical protein [Iodidimonas sp. SYSU 1G8]|uniref:beta strand repeat-containing protein n=1 Tax=Iodidimonas sp. SYSU 1G8 TaxID=3133967 RepID=UPI0031FE451E